MSMGTTMMQQAELQREYLAKGQISSVRKSHLAVTGAAVMIPGSQTLSACPKGILTEANFEQGLHLIVHDPNESTFIAGELLGDHSRLLLSYFNQNNPLKDNILKVTYRPPKNSGKSDIVFSMCQNKECPLMVTAASNPNFEEYLRILRELKQKEEDEQQAQQALQAQQAQQAQQQAQQQGQQQALQAQQAQQAQQQQQEQQQLQQQPQQQQPQQLSQNKLNRIPSEKPREDSKQTTSSDSSVIKSPEQIPKNNKNNKIANPKTADLSRLRCGFCLVGLRSLKKKTCAMIDNSNFCRRLFCRN